MGLLTKMAKFTNTSFGMRPCCVMLRGENTSMPKKCRRMSNEGWQARFTKSIVIIFPENARPTVCPALFWTYIRSENHERQISCWWGVHGLWACTRATSPAAKHLQYWHSPPVYQVWTRSELNSAQSVRLHGAGIERSQRSKSKNVLVCIAWRCIRFLTAEIRFFAICSKVPIKKLPYWFREAAASCYVSV